MLLATVTRLPWTEKGGKQLPKFWKIREERKREGKKEREKKEKKKEKGKKEEKRIKKRIRKQTRYTYSARNGSGFLMKHLNNDNKFCLTSLWIFAAPSELNEFLSLRITSLRKREETCEETFLTIGW